MTKEIKALFEYLQNFNFFDKKQVLATLLIAFSWLFISQKGLKKLLSILVNHTFATALIVFVIGLYLPSDIAKTAAFTYSSVVWGFWFIDERRQEDEKARIEEKNKEARRKERFYLGLIWEELRFNRNKLAEMKKNFKFDYTTAFPFFVQTTYVRYTKIYASGTFEFESYNSLKTSGNIINVSSDDVYNAIEIAYKNIKILRSIMSNVNQNFATNASLFPVIAIPLIPDMLTLIQSMKVQTRMVSTELAISYRTVQNAINVIDKHLDSLNVKVSETELRVSVLKKSDKSFRLNSTKWTNHPSYPTGTPMQMI